MITQRILPRNCYSKHKLDSVDLIVKHHISGKYAFPDDMYNTDKIIQIFKDYKVSAHYLIARDGDIIQLVPEEYQAWHAGKSSWKGRDKCNEFSIGVELAGSDLHPFTDAQYASDGWLTAKLMGKYGLNVSDVTGHRNIAPSRKTDPSDYYDWGRVRAMIDSVNADID